MDVFRDEESARLAREAMLVEEAVVDAPVFVDVELKSPRLEVMSTEQAEEVPAAATLASMEEASISSTSTVSEARSTTSSASPTASISSATKSVTDQYDTAPTQTTISSTTQGSTSSTTTTRTSSIQPSSSIAATSLDASSISVRPRNETRVHQPHPPPPASTGESIYGAITKRLTALERDTALTLRYIEEQGRIFQSIFARIETKIGDMEVAVR